MRSRRYAATVCTERCRSSAEVRRECLDQLEFGRGKFVVGTHVGPFGAARLPSVGVAGRVAIGGAVGDLLCTNGGGRLQASPAVQVSRGRRRSRLVARSVRRRSGRDPSARARATPTAPPRPAGACAATIASTSPEPARASYTRRSSASSVGGGAGGESGGVPEVVEQVVGAADHGRSVADQGERHLGERTRHRPRNREDVAAEVEGVIDADHRAAAARALDHHERAAERGDQPVARREAEGLGHHAGRVLADDGAGPRDALDQLAAALRVRQIVPRPEHRDAGAAQR